MDLYLLVMADMKNVEYRFVEKAEWDWIGSGVMSKTLEDTMRQRWKDELVKDDPFDEEEFQDRIHVHAESGSLENDRALAVVELHREYSVKEMMTYVAENNVHIVKESDYVIY